MSITVKTMDILHKCNKYFVKNNSSYPENRILTVNSVLQKSKADKYALGIEYVLPENYLCYEYPHQVSRATFVVLLIFLILQSDARIELSSAKPNMIRYLCIAKQCKSRHSDQITAEILVSVIIFSHINIQQAYEGLMQQQNVRVSHIMSGNLFCLLLELIQTRRDNNELDYRNTTSDRLH